MDPSPTLKHLLASANLLLASLLSPQLLAADSEIDVVDKKISALRLAMINADAKALKTLSSPLLSYGHSGGHIENQAEFIEKIASGKSDFITMDLSEQTISISGDTALVRHVLNADIKDGGVANTIKLGVLLVWQKQRGEWKLLARQAFKFPPPVTQ